MKIIVVIKLSLYHSDQAQIKQGCPEAQQNNLFSRLNESNENALEAALLLKDRFKDACDLVVISVGGKAQKSELKNSLAKGADRAILINYDKAADLDSYCLASILDPIINEQKPDLIFTGALTGENDSEYIGGYLANKLSLAYVSCVSSISCNIESASFILERELESAELERLTVKPPVVLSIQSGTNSPRYISLRRLRKISEHDIENISIKADGVNSKQIESDKIVKLIKIYSQANKSSQTIDGNVSAKVEWLADKILEFSR